jgi:hypothetical protein
MHSSVMVATSGTTYGRGGVIPHVSGIGDMSEVERGLHSDVASAGAVVGGGHRLLREASLPPTGGYGGAITGGGGGAHGSTGAAGLSGADEPISTPVGEISMGQSYDHGAGAAGRLVRAVSLCMAHSKHSFGRDTTATTSTTGSCDSAMREPCTGPCNLEWMRLLRAERDTLISASTEPCGGEQCSGEQQPERQRFSYEAAKGMAVPVAAHRGAPVPADVGELRTAFESAVASNPQGWCAPALPSLVWHLLIVAQRTHSRR